MHLILNQNEGRNDRRRNKRKLRRREGGKERHTQISKKSVMTVGTLLVNQAPDGMQSHAH